MSTLKIIRTHLLYPSINCFKSISYTTTRNVISTASSFKEGNKAQSTLDQEDVDMHSKLMDQWWNPRGPMEALHSMNLLRIPFVRDGLVPCSPNERRPAPLKGKKILDVGCGGGIMSEPLAVLGAEVTGIDASKELIELAQTHSHRNSRIKDNKPTYYCCTVEDHTPKYVNNYDAVVASEIIEHVNNKELFLKSCVEALKPGGHIFITSPNKSRATQFLGICVAEYVLNIVPKGTHQYEKLTTPNEVTFLLERNNCHVEAVYGMFYNFLTNRWDWTRSHVLMYALQAVKLKSEDESTTT